MGSLGGGGGQHGVFLINACVEFPKGYSTGSSDKKSRLVFYLAWINLTPVSTAPFLDSLTDMSFTTAPGGPWAVKYDPCRPSVHSRTQSPGETPIHSPQNTEN